MSTPAAPGVERDPFTTRRRKGDAALYHILFFCSGFAALLYQIVWQRALFTLYGVNIESVTVIVTVFMLGLGIGSLAGGALSQRRNIPLLMTFGAIETAIGLFGIVSLGLFHRIGVLTAGASLFSTGIISFAMLLVPTMLMGSTLPLLGEHFIRYSRNVANLSARSTRSTPSDPRWPASSLPCSSCVHSARPERYDAPHPSMFWWDYWPSGSISFKEAPHRQRHERPICS